MSSAAADLLVKHMIAQQSKAFFGYGPKGRATALLQDRFAVFATELEGPGLMAALAADPFGRLAMRHINRLYVQATAEPLRRVAAERFGLTLGTVESDIDFDARLSLGIAVADRPLPTAPADAPAPAPLAEAVASALGTPADVRLGPALLIAWAGAPSGIVPPDGGDPGETCAFLRDWHTFRVGLGERLKAAGKAGGLHPRGTFAALAGTGLIVGLLLH